MYEATTFTGNGGAYPPPEPVMAIIIMADHTFYQLITLIRGCFRNFVACLSHFLDR